MAKTTVFDHVLAPVPRYLMRLACLQRLLKHDHADIQHFLEIGPGLGDVAAFILEQYPASTGQLIEFSETAAQQLSQRFATTPRMVVHNHDLLDEERSSQFNLILAFEVLEHIEDDITAFRRIHAALQPGGSFLMSVPAFMKKWQKVDDWAGHYRRYEKQELQDKLIAAGFELHTLWGYGFPVTSLLYPLRQLYYWASQPADDPASKQAASQQSGINRPLQAPGWAPWMARLMAPLFLMQHAARHTNLGDGWIVLARKPA